MMTYSHTNYLNKHVKSSLLFLILGLILASANAWAQLRVIAIGGEPLYKSSMRPIMTGDKLDLATELIGGYGDSLLVWDGKKLLSLKIKPPQVKFSLNNLKLVPERKLKSLDNLDYILKHPAQNVCFITMRNKLKFKLGSYETQPPSGFMLSIRYEQNGKNPIKKRCELWGDSLIFARDNWKLPDWGDSVVTADLYHYEQKTTFYKLLGNVALMQPSSAIKRMEKLRKTLGIKSKAKAKDLAFQAFRWQYPLVIESELNTIWAETK